jgi:hypothetical protein
MEQRQVDPIFAKRWRATHRLTLAGRRVEVMILADPVARRRRTTQGATHWPAYTREQWRTRICDLVCVTTGTGARQWYHRGVVTELEVERLTG